VWQTGKSDPHVTEFKSRVIHQCCVGPVTTATARKGSPWDSQAGDDMNEETENELTNDVDVRKLEADKAFLGERLLNITKALTIAEDEMPSVTLSVGGLLHVSKRSAY